MLSRHEWTSTRSQEAWLPGARGIARWVVAGSVAGHRPWRCSPVRSVDPESPRRRWRRRRVRQSGRAPSTRGSETRRRLEHPPPGVTTFRSPKREGFEGIAARPIRPWSAKVSFVRRSMTFRSASPSTNSARVTSACQLPLEGDHLQRWYPVTGMPCSARFSSWQSLRHLHLVPLQRCSGRCKGHIRVVRADSQAGVISGQAASRSRFKRYSTKHLAFPSIVVIVPGAGPCNTGVCLHMALAPGSNSAVTGCKRGTQLHSYSYAVVSHGTGPPAGRGPGHLDRKASPTLPRAGVLR